jgi:site-specific DNA recombinase
VRLVFELFYKIRRKRAVATELNRLGHRTRTGGPFNDTGILRLIRNPTSKGMHLANYVTHSKGPRLIKQQSDWVFTECPAIVSPELWDECNRIMDEQGLKRHKPGPTAVHLLSGYVQCDCGKKMYVFHRDRSYTCKKCKRRISVSDIDEIYLEQLRGFLMTEVDPAVYIGKAESLIGEKEKLLASTVEECDRLRRKASELVNMRMNGEISRESFMEHHGPLDERLRQLSDSIPTLEGELSFLKVRADSSEAVLEDAKTLYANWPLMTLEERRSIVERITESVVVEEQDITIKLAYMPAVLQNAGNSQPLLK